MRVPRALIILASFAAVFAHPAGAAIEKPAANLVRPGASGAAWTAAEIGALDRDLDALVANAPTLHGAHIGVLVETTAGRTLYAHGSDDTVQPASTLKLIVGSVALERLGPTHRFRTTLTRTPPPPNASGSGDRLLLRGGGDPLLSATDLDAAAEAALRAGTSGPVDLRIDTSHVSSDVRKGYGWQLDDILWYYAPVVNGLPFEENVLAGWLDPAVTIGMPATLRLQPPFRPQALGSDACPGGPLLLTFGVHVRTVAAAQPSHVMVTPGRCGEIDISGDVPQGHPSSLAIAIDAPEILARLDFADALGRRGMTVAAAAPATAADPLPGVSDQPQPPGAGETVVWTHDGEPLAQLLGDFWLPSDNLVGEQLFYELDAAINHRPGGATGAIAIENAWLRGIGVDPGLVEIVDGSGLSQYDRVTPRALATVLRHDWNGPYRDIVLDALPVLGSRGDIGGIGRGSPGAGRVFAKGGSMSHVRGLAGYVVTATHGTDVIVLSVDDWLGSDEDLDAFRAAFCSRIVAG